MTAKTTLDKETDARFWAQTGYKPGQRLDPHDPTDRHMAKVWLDVRRKVAAEDAAGTLRITYDHPDVRGGISDAEVASAAAAAHLEAAAGPDPTTTDPATSDHTRAAADAVRAAAEGAARAAAAQPATVSPHVAEDAAASVASELGISTIDLATSWLPIGHPVRTSPSAAPSAHLDELGAAAHGMAGGAPPRPRSPTVSDQLAAAQAVASPRVAVAAHEDERARPSGRSGTQEPRTIDQIRRSAREIAQSVGAQHLGVVFGVSGWDGVPFRSVDEAADWYGALTDHPEEFRYVARFDQGSPAWPAPADELFGGGRAIHVSERAPDRPRLAESPWPKVAIVLGGLAAVGAVAVIASDAARRRQPSTRVTVVSPRPLSGTPRFVISGGRR